ncbi:hypothetical protein CSOJ01_16113 [Colletotrichum sojae]|uniref:Uncharacterized protein n=1 Tax=Colletotrichum sojae TaxID=2175907 RepID=A0A8H6IL51_9PEZI|nr:hypothetical protein CSOJ01_16113 [Colletotrichum sojae]
MRNEWPGPAEKTCSGTHSSSDHSNEATERAQPLAAQTNGETKIREMMSYSGVGQLYWAVVPTGLPSVDGTC